MESPGVITRGAVAALGVAAVVVLVVVPFRAPSVTTSGPVCTDEAATDLCVQRYGPEFFQSTTTETFAPCVLWFDGPDNRYSTGTSLWTYVSTTQTSCPRQYALRWLAAGGIAIMLFAARRDWRRTEPPRRRGAPATVGLLAAFAIVAIGITPFNRTRTMTQMGAISAEHPNGYIVGTAEFTGVCGGLLGAGLYDENDTVQPECDAARSAAQSALLLSLVAVSSTALLISRRRPASTPALEATAATPMSMT